MYNCQYIPGYQSDSDGGGLLGLYYDNDHFSGRPTLRVDNEVNFLWNEIAPLEGINKFN